MTDLDRVCRGSGSPPGGGLAQQAQARAQLQLEAAGLNALCSATIAAAAAAAAAAHPSAADSHAGYGGAAADGLQALETLCEPWYPCLPFVPKRESDIIELI